VIAPFEIAAGDGAVQILSAQREGKRAMLIDDVLKGMEMPAGSKFE